MSAYLCCNFDSYLLNITLKYFHKIFQVHDGLKYNCEYCKKSFTRPDKLKQHLVQMHEGEKPVENVKEEPMEHDDNAGTTSLDNNKETDADGNLPKKFKCTHCEKCFTRAHHLRKN